MGRTKCERDQKMPTLQWAEEIYDRYTETDLFRCFHGPTLYFPCAH